MARRRDLNHAAIRDALRAVGLHTVDCADLGDGFPDLIAIRDDGRCYLIEVKSDAGRLTGAEVLFVMQLVNPAYRIFYNAEQAIKAVMEV